MGPKGQPVELNGPVLGKAVKPACEGLPEKVIGALRFEAGVGVGPSVKDCPIRPLVDDSETTRDDRFFRNVFVNDSRFDIP